MSRQIHAVIAEVWQEQAPVRIHHSGAKKARKRKRPTDVHRTLTRKRHKLFLYRADTDGTVLGRRGRLPVLAASLVFNFNSTGEVVQRKTVCVLAKL